MVITLRIVQFWSEIILVNSNQTRATRSFDFEITRIISDQIALHSVQLPLFIIVVPLTGFVDKWKYIAVILRYRFDQTLTKHPHVTPPSPSLHHYINIHYQASHNILIHIISNHSCDVHFSYSAKYPPPPSPPPFQGWQFQGCLAL